MIILLSAMLINKKDLQDFLSYRSKFIHQIIHLSLKTAGFYHKRVHLVNIQFSIFIFLNSNILKYVCQAPFFIYRITCSSVFIANYRLFYSSHMVPCVIFVHSHKSSAGCFFEICAYFRFLIHTHTLLTETSYLRYFFQFHPTHLHIVQFRAAVTSAFHIRPAHA